MGTRVVNSDFWRDETVEYFTPEDKYFWLYLLTNPQSNLLGIYKITKKRIAFETGYSLESIDNLIDRFENKYGIIKYKDSEIAIKNYLRHGVIKGGQPVYEALIRLLKDVKHKEFIAWVYESVINRSDILPTVRSALDDYVVANEDVNANAYAYANAYANEVTHTVTESVTESVTQKCDENHKYGKYGWVKLTDAQYEKLEADLGIEELKRCIQYIDESAQSTGNKNKWKDWNLVIRRCAREGWGKSKFGTVNRVEQRINEVDKW